VYGGESGGLFGAPSFASPELDNLARTLLAAEAAMGVNVGALALAPGVGVGATSYTDAIVSGAASVDPSAPVSALAHARLLDQYAGVVSALELVREESARAQSSMGDLKEAATRQAAFLLKVQEGRRNDEALRATVRSQQDLVRRLEGAVDNLQSQLLSAAASASTAERKAARAESSARAAAEREEAAARAHRLDPEEEGALRAQLAARTARVKALEAELANSAVSFSRELSTVQGRLMEVEGALAEREQRASALGDTLHRRLNRASDRAGERYAASHQPPVRGEGGETASGGNRPRSESLGSELGLPPPNYSDRSGGYGDGGLTAGGYSGNPYRNYASNGGAKLQQQLNSKNGRISRPQSGGQDVSLTGVEPLNSSNFRQQQQQQQKSLSIPRTSPPYGSRKDISAPPNPTAPGLSLDQDLKNIDDLLGTLM